MDQMKWCDGVKSMICGNIKSLAYCSFSYNNILHTIKLHINEITPYHITIIWLHCLVESWRRVTLYSDSLFLFQAFLQNHSHLLTYTLSLFAFRIPFSLFRIPFSLSFFHLSFQSLSSRCPVLPTLPLPPLPSPRHQPPPPSPPTNSNPLFQPNPSRWT